VQFGEGGAGAFSDGKLTTGISDPRCGFVLKTLHEHGAPEEILYRAKPHIGTDRLPGVVKSIREEIERLGGEVLFETRLADWRWRTAHPGRAAERGKAASGRSPAKTSFWRLGHSARDTFEPCTPGRAHARQAFSIGGAH
jgi:uncharacterized FAD-dependent dehydrogenase